MVEASTGQANGKLLKKAQLRMKEGNYAIKTGVFKWSANYAEACIKFEEAGRFFKELGLNKDACDAYISLAKAAEKQDDMLSAGEGYSEVALLSPLEMWKQSMLMLKKADQCFKIGGQSDRGFNMMKQLATSLSQSEKDSELKAATELFKELLPLYFQGDNSCFNFDFIEIYARHLGEQEEWADMIALKETLISSFKQEKKADHRLRRAYLEILLCQILREDLFRLEQTLDKFSQDCGGNPYAHDEYDYAQQLKESLNVGKQNGEDADFAKFNDALKKPLFGFLESHVVKSVKRWGIEQQRKQAKAMAGAGLTTEGQQEQQSKKGGDLPAIASDLEQLDLC